jgi:ribosomal protein S15
LTPAFSLPLRPFSATAAPLAKATGRNAKRQTHDPYILAQQALKKAANLSRRADLDAGRVQAMGDPVRGITTPYVESFATASPLPSEPKKVTPEEVTFLNYALKPEEVQNQLEESAQIAVPLDQKRKAELAAAKAAANKPRGAYSWNLHWGVGSNAEPERELSPKERDAARKQDHERATEAISRIMSLENGSSKMRMKVNVARCVTTFGRHNTDKIMPPRAPPLPAVNSEGPHPIRPATNIAETHKRIGPDTGSSEVQIAILTAKIKTLADFLSVRGKGDKHNKRNLRLLVHRRQKLLQYMRRKERGGPRWQHLIETLGLTEGTWRGEISL